MKYRPLRTLLFSATTLLLLTFAKTNIKAQENHSSQARPDHESRQSEIDSCQVESWMDELNSILTTQTSGNITDHQGLWQLLSNDQALIKLNRYLTHNPDDLEREFVNDLTQQYPEAYKFLRSFSYLPIRQKDWRQQLSLITDKVRTLAKNLQDKRTPQLDFDFDQSWLLDHLDTKNLTKLNEQQLTAMQYPVRQETDLETLAQMQRPPLGFPDAEVGDITMVHFPRKHLYLGHPMSPENKVKRFFGGAYLHTGTVFGDPTYPNQPLQEFGALHIGKSPEKAPLKFGHGTYTDLYRFNLLALLGKKNATILKETLPQVTTDQDLTQWLRQQKDEVYSELAQTSLSQYDHIKTAGRLKDILSGFPRLLPRKKKDRVLAIDKKTRHTRTLSDGETAIKPKTMICSDFAYRFTLHWLRRLDQKIADQIHTNPTPRKNRRIKSSKKPIYQPQWLKYLPNMDRVAGRKLNPKHLNRILSRWKRKGLLTVIKK
jgi:hypothetical protein